MVPMSSSNVELARRGFEALKRGDLSEIDGMLDENVQWHAGDPTAAYACHNRRQALAYMQRPGRRGPGELVDVIDAGDRVVVITQPPPEEDGSPAELHAQITTFRDGRVTEMVGYPTVEAALDAAGVEWSR
jgi:ketosteroid isomerase-like protein